LDLEDYRSGVHPDLWKSFVLSTNSHRMSPHLSIIYTYRMLYDMFDHEWKSYVDTGRRINVVAS
jgi:hypothetical protein